MKSSLAFILMVVAVANAQATDISGTWVARHCGPRCGALVIHQQAGRVCGFWYHATASTEYGGRFIGLMDGEVLTEAQVCGIPSSRTQSYCPAPSAYLVEPLLPHESVGWNPGRMKWRLCNGVLFEFKTGRMPPKCNEISEKVLRWSSTGLERTTKPVTNLVSSHEAEEKDWLSKCLK